MPENESLIKWDTGNPKHTILDILADHLNGRIICTDDPELFILVTPMGVYSISFGIDLIRNETNIAVRHVSEGICLTLSNMATTLMRILESQS